MLDTAYSESLEFMPYCYFVNDYKCVFVCFLRVCMWGREG